MDLRYLAVICNLTGSRRHSTMKQLFYLFTMFDAYLVQCYFPSVLDRGQEWRSPLYRCLQCQSYHALQHSHNGLGPWTLQVTKRNQSFEKHEQLHVIFAVLLILGTLICQWKFCLKSKALLKYTAGWWVQLIFRPHSVCSCLYMCLLHVFPIVLVN